MIQLWVKPVSHSASSALVLPDVIGQVFGSFDHHRPFVTHRNEDSFFTEIMVWSGLE